MSPLERELLTHAKALPWPEALAASLEVRYRTHMKTTVEIAEDLLRQAKAVADREHTTLRALVEEGLRWVIGSRRRSGRFKLRQASVRGNGLQPGVAEGDWAALRDNIYRGRGS